MALTSRLSHTEWCYKRSCHWRERIGRRARQRRRRKPRWPGRRQAHRHCCRLREPRPMISYANPGASSRQTSVERSRKDSKWRGRHVEGRQDESAGKGGGTQPAPEGCRIVREARVDCSKRIAPASRRAGAACVYAKEHARASS
eukprot:scaffold144404_cov26-Tisochrysis_lutea.AAC.5